MFEPSAWRDRVLPILRIVAGLLFVSAGTTKLFGYPPTPMAGPPLEVMSQIWIGAALEVVGGHRPFEGRR